MKRPLFLLLLLAGSLAAANSTMNFTNGTQNLYPGDCLTLAENATNFTVCALYPSFNLTYYVNATQNYTNPIVNLTVLSNQPVIQKNNLTVYLGNGSAWQENQTNTTFIGNGSVVFQNLTVQNVTQVTVVNITNVTTVQNVTVVTQVVNVTGRYQYNISLDPMGYDAILNITEAGIFIHAPTKKLGLRDTIYCPENYTNADYDIRLEVRNTTKACEDYSQVAQNLPNCAHAVNVPICVDAVSEGDLKLFLRGNASEIKDVKVAQMLSDLTSTNQTLASYKMQLENSQKTVTDLQARQQSFDLGAEIWKQQNLYLFAALAVFVAVLLVGVVMIHRAGTGHRIGRGAGNAGIGSAREDYANLLREPEKKEIFKKREG